MKRRWYELPRVGHLEINWELFGSFEEACKRHPTQSCLYTLSRREDRRCLYVGKATGLRRRYATAYGALKALMAESGVVLFVAAIEQKRLELLEHTLIFWEYPPYNKRGHHTRPAPHLRILHRFNGVSSWWGGGTPCEEGARYEGPLFCGPGDMRDAATGVLKK